MDLQQDFLFPCGVGDRAGRQKRRRGRAGRAGGDGCGDAAAWMEGDGAKRWDSRPSRPSSIDRRPVLALLLEWTRPPLVCVTARDPLILSAYARRWMAELRSSAPSPSPPHAHESAQTRTDTHTSWAHIQCPQISAAPARPAMCSRPACGRRATVNLGAAS